MTIFTASLTEVFLHIFDSSDFMTRNNCGPGWNNELIWLHIVSETMVWLAYMAIPLLLLYFIRKRKDVPFRGIFWLFICFILFCGFTHLLGALMFKTPMYRFDGLLKFATALVSWATVFALIPTVPRMLALRSPEELEAEINQRRQAQSDLKELNETLEKRVEDRTAELKSRNEELAKLNHNLKQAMNERDSLEKQIQHAQRLESLGVLAGGIAHDFNNILMGILGNADLALEETSPASPARQRLEDLKQASLRAADLTNQMLAYSGKGRFVVEVMNLNEVIREMTHLLHASISKKVSLNFHLAKDLPTVEVDVNQIRQVVMNLITNASEAIGDHEGSVTIATGVVDADEDYLRGMVLHEEMPTGRYVFLEVSDTGAGMDAETREKIFDPFFTTKFTGRGLGLAAVLGIIRGHRGSLKVYSELGSGTTFKILLPASDQSVRAQMTHPGREAVPSERSLTVLVADDEETVRKVLEGMLGSLGHHVLLARNGLEAVEMFRTHSEIDLVILDMTMPVMDGKEAFSKIQRIREGTKVLLSSGYNEQDATNRFAGRGLAGFIQKPFTKDKLKDAIAKTQKTSPMADELQSGNAD